jgi:hypothetical protein
LSIVNKKLGERLRGSDCVHKRELAPRHKNILNHGVRFAQVWIQRRQGSNKARTYRCLRRLQAKDLVESTPSHPTCFTAVPVKPLLNLITSYKKNVASNLEKKRAGIINEFRILQDASSVGSIQDEVFDIVKGINRIYRKIRRVCSQAQRELLIMCDDLTVPKANIVDNLGILLGLAKKRKIKVKLLTNSSPENIDAACLLLKKANIDPAYLEVRYALCPTALPNLLISDETELIMGIHEIIDNSLIEPQEDFNVLYLNGRNVRSFVVMMCYVFESVWNKAVNLDYICQCLKEDNAHETI